MGFILKQSNFKYFIYTFLITFLCVNCVYAEEINNDVQNSNDVCTDEKCISDKCQETLCNALNNPALNNKLCGLDMNSYIEDYELKILSEPDVYGPIFDAVGLVLGPIMGTYLGNGTGTIISSIGRGGRAANLLSKYPKITKLCSKITTGLVVKGVGFGYDAVWSGKQTYENLIQKLLHDDPSIIKDLSNLICDNTECQDGYKLCGDECCENCSKNIEGKMECTSCGLYKISDNYDKDMRELYPESFYFNGLRHTHCVYECKNGDSFARCKINQKCEKDSNDKLVCVDKCKSPYKNTGNILDTECECEGENVSTGLCCKKGHILCNYKINAWRHDKVRYYGKDEPVTLPRYKGDDKYICCDIDSYCTGITFYEDETLDMSKVCVKKNPCKVDDDDSSQSASSQSISSRPAPSWGINSLGYADCICPSDTIPCGVMSNKNLKKPENSNMKCCLSEEVCMYNENDNTYECKHASSLCDEGK